jgi:hypothetical protein
MGHRLYLRIFVDTDWDPLWRLFLYRFDGGPGTLHFQYSLYGFPLLRIPIIQQLLRGSCFCASTCENS